MNELIDKLNNYIKSIDRLIKEITKGSNKQITSSEDKQIIQAHIYSWINNFRLLILNVNKSLNLEEINKISSDIIKKSFTTPTRSLIVDKLKLFKKLLCDLISSEDFLFKNNNKLNTLPDFSSFNKDTNIQKLLTDRWIECEICVENKANLAAIVMIGGLIEALLLAKINQLTDKSIVTKSTSAPRDKHGKTLQFNDWTLKNYIEVAYDLKWITSSVKDLIIILRDYRNYIHPYKEFTKSKNFNDSDIEII